MERFFGFLESGLVVLMAVTLLVAVAYCAMRWSRRFAWGFSDVLHGRVGVGDALGRMLSHVAKDGEWIWVGFLFLVLMLVMSVDAWY